MLFRSKKQPNRRSSTKNRQEPESKKASSESSEDSDRLERQSSAPQDRAPGPPLGAPGPSKVGHFDIKWIVLAEKPQEPDSASKKTSQRPRNQEPGSSKQGDLPVRGRGQVPERHPPKTTGDVVKALHEQSPKELSEESSEEASTRISKQASKKASKKAPKKAPEKAPKKEFKRPPKGSGKAPEKSSENPSDSSSDDDSSDVEQESVCVSFVARVQEVDPLFELRGIQYNRQKMWDPPKTKEEFKAFKPLFFRWEDGLMEHITPNWAHPLRAHNVGSVFVQEDEGYLLITNVNVATHDVRDSLHRSWTRLFFDHKRVPKTRRDYFTALRFTGQEFTAARLSPHCVPQLIPGVYNNTNSRNRNAGLIGRLPLLMALAVLSAPKQNTVGVLTESLRPGRWHPHPYPAGRRKHRGVIINICYDPDNPNGSNKESLAALENGEMGPFYD